MIVIQLIIYVLAVNGLGLDGESAEIPLQNPIRTDALSFKSVINNSSLTSTLKNRNIFIVTNVNTTPNVSPLTTLMPFLMPHTEIPQLPSDSNNEAKAKAKATTSNYYSEPNARSPLTTNNRMDANREWDNDELNTNVPKTQAMSESDIEINTQTPSLTVSVVMSVHKDDELECTHQLQALAPINVQKILLTGNSYNEQLNNDMSGSRMLTNNDGGYVPRSVSNSIIAATPATIATISIGNSAKMLKIPLNKIIESFSSVATEKSTSIYTTRAPCEERTNSPSSLLSSSLSTADKHDSQMDVTQSKTAIAASRAINSINPPNAYDINGLKNNKIPLHSEKLGKNFKSTADDTINAVVYDSLNIKYGSDLNNTEISICDTNTNCDTKKNLIETKPNEIPIDLNHSEMPLQYVTVFDDEKFTDRAKKNVAARIQYEKLKTAVSRLVKTNENENGATNKSADQKKNETNSVNKQTFVLASKTNEFTVSIAPAVSNNASAHFNLLHLSDSTRMNVASQKPNRNKVKPNMHNNDPSTNGAKTSIAKVSSVNFNGTMNPSNESGDKFTDMIKGMGKNTNSNHNTNNSKKSQSGWNRNTNINISSKNLSKPSEIISLNLNTSPKLTMSSLLVDKENKSFRSSVNRLVTSSNAAETTVSTVHWKLNQSQDGNNTNSSEKFKNHTQNIGNDHHDLSIVSATAADDFKSFKNGTSDKVTPATKSSSTFSNHYLPHSDFPNDGNYLNNFLTAAITAEHEVGNQFSIEYLNGSINANGRCDSFLLFICNVCK